MRSLRDFVGPNHLAVETHRAGNPPSSRRSFDKGDSSPFPPSRPPGLRYRLLRMAGCSEGWAGRCGELWQSRLGWLVARPAALRAWMVLSSLRTHQVADTNLESRNVPQHRDENGLESLGFYFGPGLRNGEVDDFLYPGRRHSCAHERRCAFRSASRLHENSGCPGVRDEIVEVLDEAPAV